MRVVVEVNDSKVQIFKNSLRLHSELGQRISTALFTIVGEDMWVPPALSIAPVAAIGGCTRPYNWDECKIDRGLIPLESCAIAPVAALGGESKYLDHFFGGYIVSVEKTKLGAGLSRALYHCQAQDHNILPTRILVTQNYVAQTEQQIIDDLFTTYLPEVDTTTYVESSGVVITIDWARKTLTEAVEELATIYEKEWYIDHEKYLHYFTPATTGVPFALSDEPALTTFLGYKNIRHIETFFGPTNKVTVVGDPSVPIVVTRQDNASYAEYGRWFEAKYVDAAIDTVAWANAVGDAILTESAFEKVAGSLICYQEGIEKGQKVRIINDFRNIDDYYLIQSVDLSMISVDQEKVYIEYGDYKPTLIDLFRIIREQERREE